MSSITRQALTDAIDPEELANDKRMREFTDARAWLFLAICANDVIVINPAVSSQLRSMFPARDWPRTRANVETLLGA